MVAVNMASEQVVADTANDWSVTRDKNTGSATPAATDWESLSRTTETPSTLPLLRGPAPAAPAEPVSLAEWLSTSPGTNTRAGAAPAHTIENAPPGTLLVESSSLSDLLKGADAADVPGAAPATRTEKRQAELRQEYFNRPEVKHQAVAEQLPSPERAAAVQDRSKNRSWAAYDALPDRRMLADDWNSMLRTANRRDLRLNRSGVPPTETERQTYFDKADQLFGKELSSDRYAPETLSLAEQLGANKLNFDLDELIDGRAVIGKGTRDTAWAQGIVENSRALRAKLAETSRPLATFDDTATAARRAPTGGTVRAATAPGFGDDAKSKEYQQMYADLLAAPDDATFEVLRSRLDGYLPIAKYDRNEVYDFFNLMLNNYDRAIGTDPARETLRTRLGFSALPGGLNATPSP